MEMEEPPPMSSKDAGKIVEETSHPDAKVHTFDENMTPEQKQEQVNKSGPTASSSGGVEGASQIPGIVKNNVRLRKNKTRKIRRTNKNKYLKMITTSKRHHPHHNH
jgi:hypothetical protein